MNTSVIAPAIESPLELATTCYKVIDRVLDVYIARQQLTPHQKAATGLESSDILLQNLQRWYHKGESFYRAAGSPALPLRQQCLNRCHQANIALFFEN